MKPDAVTLHRLAKKFALSGKTGASAAS